MGTTNVAAKASVKDEDGIVTVTVGPRRTPPPVC